jgi:elongator complex protein 3
VFGSFESAKSGMISAFVRMRIPSAGAHRPEMQGAAVIRELRVYGRTVRVGQRHDAAWQHRGLGSELMRRMEKVAAEDCDRRRILVTSAVGTRDYYKKLGYGREGPYMGRALK